MAVPQKNRDNFIRSPTTKLSLFFGKPRGMYKSQSSTCIRHTEQELIKHAAMIYSLGKGALSLVICISRCSNTG